MNDIVAVDAPEYPGPTRPSFAWLVHVPCGENETGIYDQPVYVTREDLNLLLDVAVRPDASPWIERIASVDGHVSYPITDAVGQGGKVLVYEAGNPKPCTLDLDAAICGLALAVSNGLIPVDERSVVPVAETPHLLKLPAGTVSMCEITRVGAGAALQYALLGEVRYPAEEGAA